MDLDNIKCITNDKVNGITQYINKLLNTNNLDKLQDIINTLLNKKNINTNEENVIKNIINYILNKSNNFIKTKFIVLIVDKINLYNNPCNTKINILNYIKEKNNPKFSNYINSYDELKSSFNINNLEEVSNNELQKLLNKHIQLLKSLNTLQEHINSLSNLKINAFIILINRDCAIIQKINDDNTVNVLLLPNYIPIQIPKSNILFQF
jgi:hypothetical protein